MSATHFIAIEGAEKHIQAGWTFSATANGRDTLTCDVISVDGSYRPALDDEFVMLESVAVVSSSVADPTHIITAEPHGIVSGQTITIGSHVGSTPSINATYYVATRVSDVEFTIPVNVTVGGAGGQVNRRLVGGNVFSKAEYGLGGYGVTPIVQRLNIADNSAKAERRYFNGVLIAGTLASMLGQLATACGFTLHALQPTGPTLTENITCEYALVRDVLDQLTSQTGYTWEFDEYDYLSMHDSSTVPAPVNVVDGNGVAIGDIEVEPTRTNYANRVILRFMAGGTTAYGYLGATDNFSHGETVTIGGQVYTFRTVVTDVPGYVLLGGDAAESIVNLSLATIKGPGSGTIYAASTVANTAAAGYQYGSGGTILKTLALVASAAGNSIAVSTTAADASWYWEGGSAITTLAGGGDPGIGGDAISIAEDLTEQASHGIWEVIIDAENITNRDEADVQAAAYLATKILMPRTVRYNTYAIGLKPGQSQTITVGDRDLDGVFTITDVVHKHQSGNRILRSVTAVESGQVQAVARWRDLYKQWSGSLRGASGGVSGGGSLGTAKVIISFGGSQTEWQQTTAGDWVAANSIQVQIDTTVLGKTSGIAYVRLRAASGTVTCRLRNLTDGSTAGTSAAVASASFQTVSFAVTFAAGAKLYEMQLMPSESNVDVQMGSGYVE